MEKFSVVIMGETLELTESTTLLELSKQFSHKFKSPIILGVVDGKLKEMSHVVKKPCNIKWLDMVDKDGFKTYQRSLSFVLIKAFHDVFGLREDRHIIIQFSINNGFYVEVKPKDLLNPDSIDKIEARMHELIRQDIPYEKNVFKTDDALDVFEEQHMHEKVNLLKYRRVSNINLYNLNGLYDYFYGYMVPSTGCLGEKFKLYPYSEGLVLQFMDREQPDRVSPFNPDKQLFKTLKASKDWSPSHGDG